MLSWSDGARALILVAGLFGAVLVAAAAAGAHLVVADIRATDPAPPLLRQWDQAVLFGLLHLLAALACAALPLRSPVRIASGWLFIAGVLLFSGVQLARIAGADLPGTLVPMGGLCLIAGWLLLAGSAIFAKR